MHRPRNNVSLAWLLAAASLSLPSCRSAAPMAEAPLAPRTIALHDAPTPRLPAVESPAEAMISDEGEAEPASQIVQCAAEEPAAPELNGVEGRIVEEPAQAAVPRVAIRPKAARGCASCGPTAAPGCASCASCPPGSDCADRPRNPHEWLCDGDDAPPDVRLTIDGRVEGLDSEDTVAIWDSDDGRTEIVASNRVCIYAPRFAAVRKVITPYEGAGVDGSQPLTRPEGPARLDLLAEPATRASKEELLAQRLARKAGGLEASAIDGLLSSQLNPEGFSDAFLPFENLLLLRTGRAQANEAVLLEAGLQAARVWTADQAVQVAINGQAAIELEGDRKVQAIFTADPQGEAKLRVWKVASTDAAQPGDEVDFTIRFDNIGTRVIERVSLMDRLTTRLDYIEGSAQASRAAAFSTELIEGQTVLHWEFDEPLPAGQGGLVRFKCKVQ